MKLQVDGDLVVSKKLATTLIPALRTLINLETCTSNSLTMTGLSFTVPPLLLLEH